MVYLYRSHMGGVYTCDKKLSFDDLYCEECGDSDDDYGWVDENDLSQLVDAASCMGYWAPISTLCTPSGLARVARDYDEGLKDYDQQNDGSLLTEYASDTVYDLLQVMRAVGYKGIDLSKPECELAPDLEKIILNQAKTMLADRGVYPIDEGKIYRDAVDGVKGKTASQLLAMNLLIDEGNFDGAKVKTANQVLAMNLLGLCCDRETGELGWMWPDVEDVYVDTPDPWWSIVHRAYCENVDGYKEAWAKLTGDAGKIAGRVDKYAPEWAQVLRRDLPGLDGKIYEYVIKDANVKG